MNEITFKYKGKIYNPKNFEKKLKQLRITKEDIEIIETPKPKEKQNSIWEFEGIKEWRYYKHPDSNIRHCCLIDIGTNPSKEKIFKNHFNKEYINELCECNIGD